ncbi:MAG: patatin-like phospholipase family protein, partial [Planctomycetota bacterium]
MGFGGGAAHGLAGNGALAALLEELGLRPHVREVWGTSAGAIVGAAWAGGLHGRDILERLRIRARR